MQTDSGGVPDLAILVDGVAIPMGAYTDLLDVQVQDDTDALSACTLSFAAWDDQKVALAWVDETLFSPGGELEIKLGYTDALATVFHGEITGLELELAAAQAPRFVVRGYDLRHRLARGSRMRTFTNMKDSDIVAQLARENQLTSDVTDSKVSHEYVLQDGLSDLDFLRARSASIGYEVVASGKTLTFRPVDTSAEAAVVLAVDEDLLELSLRLSTRGQVGAIEVRGWDVDGKQAIVGKAETGQEAPMGSVTGPKAADEAFGKATLHVVDRAPMQQNEADQLALSFLERIALSFVRAEGACVGRTDLQAGVTIEIQGAGDRFSGNYYLTSVTHSFSSKMGYRTSFAGKRNAS